MTGSGESPPPLWTWRVHPASKRPLSALLAGAVIFGFSLAAAWAFDHFGWGLLSAAVLLLSLNQFFLPSTFTIDESGVLARFPLATRRMEWKHVRRMETGPHTVLLSMNHRRTWLNARRELRLPLGTDRPRTLELIRARLPHGVLTEGLPPKGKAGSSARP